MTAMPKETMGFAPYDPSSGKIYVSKIAERPEDVPALADCVTIAVKVLPAGEGQEP
jgi:hypothetical protein